MNKTELVAAIADKAEISKKDSEKALKAFVDVVTEELKKGNGKTRVQRMDQRWNTQCIFSNYTVGEK